MRREWMIASATGVLLAVLLLGRIGAQAQSAGTPVTLDCYTCVLNVSCGAASEPCWGEGHKRGASYCVRCTGSAKKDFCQKADCDDQCQHNGSMGSCGAKYSGDCIGGPIGTCTGGQQISNHCGMPMCD